MNWFHKLKGDGQPLPAPYGIRTISLAATGAALVILGLGYLAEYTQYGLMMGAFGASSLLVFGFPDAPFSQPRNVLGGYFISTVTGLACMHFVATAWWAAALAVGIAMFLMMMLRVVHPPAAGNPIVIFILKAQWSFLLLPTLSGATFILLVALVYNNVVRTARYPKYW